MGATNRQHFEKYQKKGIHKSMRTTSAERTTKNEKISQTGSALMVISGLAVEGFREGVGWFLLGSRVVPM
jgi:hypothetical protein